MTDPQGICPEARELLRDTWMEHDAAALALMANRSPERQIAAARQARKSAIEGAVSDRGDIQRDGAVSQALVLRGLSLLWSEADANTRLTFLGQFGLVTEVADA